MHLGQRAPVLVREYLHELRPRGFPVVEKLQRERAAREAQMPLDQLAHQRLVRLDRDAAAVPLPAAASSASAAACAASVCNGSSATIAVLQRCANVPSAS